MTTDTKKDGWKPVLQTVAHDGLNAVQSEIGELPFAILCIASNGSGCADYSTERRKTPQQATTPTYWQGVLVEWVTPREAHTDEQPFCAVMACACHFEQERMERYFIGPIERGEMEIPEAIDRYHCEVGYMARKQAEARMLEGLVLV